jgi:hypothetical protein
MGNQFGKIFNQLFYPFAYGDVIITYPDDPTPY